MDGTNKSIHCERKIVFAYNQQRQNGSEFTLHLTALTKPANGLTPIYHSLHVHKINKNYIII